MRNASPCEVDDDGEDEDGHGGRPAYPPAGAGGPAHPVLDGLGHRQEPAAGRRENLGPLEKWSEDKCSDS